MMSLEALLSEPQGSPLFLTQLLLIVKKSNGCESKPKVPFWGWESHPTIVFLKGFLGVHRGTRVLTHSQIVQRMCAKD